MLLNNIGHDIFWYTELNRDFSSRQRVGEGSPASCSTVETSSSRQRVERRHPCQLQHHWEVIWGKGHICLKHQQSRATGNGSRRRRAAVLSGFVISRSPLPHSPAGAVEPCICIYSLHYYVYVHRMYVCTYSERVAKAHDSSWPLHGPVHIHFPYSHPPLACDYIKVS